MEGKLLFFMIVPFPRGCGELPMIAILTFATNIAAECASRLVR